MNQWDIICHIDQLHKIILFFYAIVCLDYVWEGVTWMLECGTFYFLNFSFRILCSCLEFMISLVILLTKNY